jgi:hypothetical protein
MGLVHLKTSVQLSMNLQHGEIIIMFFKEARAYDIAH